MKAKTLTERQLQTVLSRANPMMRVAVLFSFRCGLRVAEIAALDWRMALDAQGTMADYLDLPAIACKGRHGAGRVLLPKDLRDALISLSLSERLPTSGRILHTARFKPLNADSLRQRLKALYEAAGLRGVSSHSGRRTFATRLAPRVNLPGLKSLMRHVRASTTLEYVDASTDKVLAAAVLALSAT